MSTLVNHSTKSQCAKIIADLKKGLCITHKYASRFYFCERLGARIYDLKKEGHKILKRTIKTRTGKRVAEYYMEPKRCGK